MHIKFAAYETFSHKHLYVQFTSEVIPTRNNGNFTWQASRHILNMKLKGDLLTGIAGGVSQHMLKARLFQQPHAVLYVCIIQVHEKSS